MTADSRKKSHADRRDARNVKDESTRDQSSPAKKNRKKWCRGRVGIEHQPVCYLYSESKADVSYGKDWRVLACSECGRHIDYYYPTSFNGKKKPLPAWVDK